MSPRLNGVALVDKQPGCTSHDVVHNARKILGTRQIGHAGTLDPMASGLLVLLVGEATKLSDYLIVGDKSYSVGVKLGLTTDSMDITGQVLASSSDLPSEEKTRLMAESQVGDLDLAVPVHSAVKVGGQRLYEFAHRGEVPQEIPRRIMSFRALQWGGMTEQDSFTVEITCSKGSYIRAWAHHVGQLLGCGATVCSLRRTWSEPFSVESSLTLETVAERWLGRAEGSGPVEALGDAWRPMSEAVSHFRRIELTGFDLSLLRNGQISSGLQSELIRLVVRGQTPPPVRVIDRSSGDLAALLTAQDGGFYRIRRVFKDL